MFSKLDVCRHINLEICCKSGHWRFDWCK